MGVFDSWDGKRVAWVVLGAVLAALIGLALSGTSVPFLFAIFLYYATRPLYRQLDRVIGHPNVTTTAHDPVRYPADDRRRRLRGRRRAQGTRSAPRRERPRGLPVDPRTVSAADSSGETSASFETPSGAGRWLVCGRASTGRPRSRRSTAVVRRRGVLGPRPILSHAHDSLLPPAGRRKLRRWFYESIDHDDDIVSYAGGRRRPRDGLPQQSGGYPGGSHRRRRHVLRAQFRRLGRDRRGDAGVVLPCSSGSGR